MTTEAVTVVQWSQRRAARELGMSQDTVRDLIAEGRLPEAYRRGRRIYIPVEGIALSQRCGWAVRSVSPALVGSVADASGVDPSTGAARTADLANAGGIGQ